MSKTLLKFNDGCTCTQPAIIPKNWKTDWKELLLKDWKLQYYFFILLLKMTSLIILEAPKKNMMKNVQKIVKGNARIKNEQTIPVFVITFLMASRF